MMFQAIENGIQNARSKIRRLQACIPVAQRSGAGLGMIESKISRLRKGIERVQQLQLKFGLCMSPGPADKANNKRLQKEIDALNAI